MNKYITPKEIAALLEVTRQCVAKNEARWKLVRVRGLRSARYIRIHTLATLRALGFIVP